MAGRAHEDAPDWTSHPRVAQPFPADLVGLRPSFAAHHARVFAVSDSVDQPLDDSGSCFCAANAAIDQSKPGSFDELALLVLVKRDDQWWLTAAQHVPDRRDVYLTKT